MIRPPGFGGTAFSAATDGDLRADRSARRVVSAALGIDDRWATVRQVHGSAVAVADRPGDQGEADAIVTTVPGLGLAVFTADCIPIVLEGPGVVAVVHAGWRGLVAGVVASARTAMEALGRPPLRAALGPAIGPCCFEVGPEVAARFAGYRSETTWGTVSVNLRAAAAASMTGIEVWTDPGCTRCGAGFFSHRRDGAPARQAGIGWVW